MNHNDNQDFTPQPADEEIAAEVTEETAAEPVEETAAEAPQSAEPKAEEAPAAAPKSKKGMLGWIIAIIAVAALIVVFVLDAREPEAPVDEPSPAPTETEAPENNAQETEATSTIDFDAAYNKYAPDTTVFTVNGAAVPWSEYYCWIFNTVNSLAMNYGITDWSMELGESYTAEDYILEAVISQSCQYPLILAKAEELGLELTDEDHEQIDLLIDSEIAVYYSGDRDAFLADLDSLYISEDYYRTMGGISILYEKIFAHFFGENGADLSDEDALAFLTDNEFMLAKHILFKTVDDAMQPLEEDVVAEKLAQAEAVLAQLKALPAEELEGTFDAIMAEQSEDPGSKTLTDGYYFQTGDMVESFENTAKELADGELSGIVESPYGYHILYRPAMDADDLFEIDTNTGAALTVRYAAAANLFNNMTADWAMNMEVELVPEFENLSLNSLFDIQ